MRIRTKHTDAKGKINYKGYQAGLIKNGQLMKSGASTKAVSSKDWYKDFTKTTDATKDASLAKAAREKAERLRKQTLDMTNVSDDVKTALDDDGSDYGVDPVGKPYTKRDGTKTADYTQSKEYKDQEDRAKAAAEAKAKQDQNDRDGDRDAENRQEIEAEQQKESVVGSDEDTAADRGMNKGGLLKRPTKKKTKKKTKRY